MTQECEDTQLAMCTYHKNVLEEKEMVPTEEKGVILIQATLPRYPLQTILGTLTVLVYPESDVGLNWHSLVRNARQIDLIHSHMPYQHCSGALSVSVET